MRVPRGAAADILAGRRFDWFCRSIDIPGAPVELQDDGSDVAAGGRMDLAAHHQLLCDKLQLVDSGDIKRMMVFMPPGSAKSTYASVLFPAWFMRKPRRNVIVATYASDLGRKIGRRMRSVVKQPAYRRIAGAGLSGESAAADQFTLTNENEIMTGGILSGITGNRADLLVIDDPIKGRQDADSETIRERTKAEYTDSLLTRGKPDFRVLLIQTRWHQDDLAGSILPEGYAGESGLILCRDGQIWEVLCIPAEAERDDDPLGRKPGDMLWPEWFPPEHWAPFRRISRTWSSLYQQRPAPDEGLMFKRQWFPYASAVPKGRRRFVRAWDFAATAKNATNNPDYTAGVLMSMGDEGDFLIHHCERFRGSPRDVKASVAHCAQGDGTGTVIRIAQDPGQAGKDQAETYVRDLKGYSVKVVRPTGDKATRASPAATQAEAGNVRILRTGNPDQDAWIEPFISELTMFPAGANDDQVDAFADALNELALGKQYNMGAFKW